ncbi:putative superfamily II DEAD-like ATP-dependent RNA helicase [Namao virus]|nr:putative superfamily II DEAD-like ATP-dependent RNA helicase [Namao virus]
MDQQQYIISKFEDLFQLNQTYHLNISEKWMQDVISCIYQYGFEIPSDVQKNGIGCILSGKDCIIQAKSGTGKTATYLLGAILQLDLKVVNQPQILCLVPTRELAVQIYQIVQDLFSDLFIKENIYSVLLIGGEYHSRKSSIYQNIIIATPGKLIDLLNTRNCLSLKSIKVLILDEGDELLSLNFRESVRQVVTAISEKTQICFLSATLPEEILKICRLFINHDSHKILVSESELNHVGLINHYYVNAEKEDDRAEILSDLLTSHWVNGKKTLVFFNSIIGLKKAYSEIKKKNILILNSHQQNTERKEIVQKFKKSEEHSVLFTTDLLSRGIDIVQITVVINFDLPLEPEIYIHRVGRCGRFGKSGLAINLTSNVTKHLLDQLSRRYFLKINPL